MEHKGKCMRGPGGGTSPKNGWVTGLLILVGILGGCQDAPAPVDSSGENRKYTIAVIPKGTTHDFWRSIRAGALQAAEELGNVEVIWQGPAREDDRQQQIQVVENMINRRVDAIVLAPLDKESLVAYVDQAMAKKIPVIIIDSGLASDNIVSYISTDNYNGGRLAARRMGERLAGKGRIVVLRYQVGSASTEEREAGFLDTIRAEFPNIEILSADLYSGATREEAMNKAENLLANFGDRIDGWFCPCEPVTYGTLQALRNQKRAGKIVLVGFDAGTEVVAALAAGEVDALILQDPIRMRYLGVRTAIEHLEGKEIPRKLSTGENLITKENMDQERERSLHSPDLKRWLGADA